MNYGGIQEKPRSPVLRLNYGRLERPAGLAPAWSTVARWRPAAWATAARKGWQGPTGSNRHLELQKLAAFRLAEAPLVGA